MKLTFTRSLRTLGVALVLLAGVTIVSAYNPPLQNFPNGNVASPVHTGAQAQLKAGNLNVQGDFATGGYTILGGNPASTLVFGNLGVWGSSQFYSNVTIAGANPFDPDQAELPADLYVSRNISNKGNIVSQSLTHSQWFGPAREPVCSLSSGQLILCNPEEQVAIEPGDFGLVQPTGQIEYPNPGSYTFTVPDGVTSVKVKLWGAGGGGGKGRVLGDMYADGTLKVSEGPSGGGGGYTADPNNSQMGASLTVEPGQQISVQVGAGGAAATANEGDGGNGGPSGFVYTTGGVQPGLFTLSSLSNPSAPQFSIAAPGGRGGNVNPGSAPDVPGGGGGVNSIPFQATYSGQSGSYPSQNDSFYCQQDIIRATSTRGGDAAGSAGTGGEVYSSETCHPEDDGQQTWTASVLTPVTLSQPTGPGGGGAGGFANTAPGGAGAPQAGKHGKVIVSWP